MSSTFNLPQDASDTDFENLTNELTSDNVQDSLVEVVDKVNALQVANEIQVNKGGDNTTATGTYGKPFLTVEAALAHVNTLSPSQINPLVIKLGPGIFSENPLVLPEYVSILGDGARSIINAINPNADLITTSQNTTLKNLAVMGVTNVANYCIRISGNTGGATLTQSVSILNASNGVITSNATNELECIFQSLFIENVSGQVINGGLGTDNVCLAWYVKGNGATNVFKGVSDSSFRIFDSILENCAVGLEFNSTGTMTVNSTDLLKCTTPLIKVGTSKIVMKGTSLDGNKIVLTDTTGLEGYVHDDDGTGTTLTVYDEFFVGRPEKGKETALGEGNSYTNNMLVYTSPDGISFTDISVAAKSKTGSSFTFPTNLVGSSIYISTDKFSEGTVLPFFWYGFKTLTTTAALGGLIVAEYWDGAAWIETSHMSTMSGGQALPYAKKIFQRVGSEHVRFNNNIKVSWIANDPITLGKNLYWIRLRIVTPLTTLPVFERFKIHTNRIEFEADGFQENFGTSRPINILPVDSSIIKGAVLGPSKTELYLSQNLSFKGSDNRFDPGVIGQVGFARPIPADVDTSTPLVLRLYLTSLGASTTPSTWTVRWAPSVSSSLIYNNNANSPATATGEQSIIQSLAPTGINSQYYMEFELDVSDVVTLRPNAPGDLLWISIERGVDANPDAIALIQVELLYTSWSRGGHIG